MVFGVTLRVTTLPAPTMAFSPMMTLQRIVDPDPMEAPLQTRVCSTLPILFGLQAVAPPLLGDRNH